MSAQPPDEGPATDEPVADDDAVSRRRARAHASEKRRTAEGAREASDEKRSKRRDSDTEKRRQAEPTERRSETETEKRRKLATPEPHDEPPSREKKARKGKVETEKRRAAELPEDEPEEVPSTIDEEQAPSKREAERREARKGTETEKRRAEAGGLFDETLTSEPQGRRTKPETSTGRRRQEGSRRRGERPARRHPDIEVARLLVKRGIVKKAAAVEALRTQKTRAKVGKPRIPFLQLLVREGALEAARLDAAQDEIRKNTYICDACDARAVVLAGSQTRAGTCPRCGAEISCDPAASDPVPARELQATADKDEGSKTEGWRPLEGAAAAMRDLAPGKVVFERYELGPELGRGAMGVVFRARHLELGKEVALKILIPHDGDREHQVARFRREAAAVQRLRHDGIVPVHDFGGDGDLYYLTMDLVEGGESLHRALKRRDGALPLKERLQIMAQVARAVGHAHARGVVHRDLKPANVLLDPGGRALVADFGLAKDEEAEEGELTRTHDRLGTPLFMAPEQIRRGASSVDGRADVWALGVMLFVCATGRYPFRSRTVMDLYLRILREQPDWTGTRYSAPDRAAPPPVDPARPAGARPSPSPPAAGLARGDKPVPPPRVSDPSERTEVCSDRGRDADGQLPKTLALGAEESATDVRPRKEDAVPPPFAPPPDLRGEVPRDLVAVIEGALAKEPDDRYPTAEAFAADIERVIAGEPVLARRPSLARRMRRALSRKRVIVPLALGATALALGLGATTLGLAARAAARERREAARQRIDSIWERTGAQERYEEVEGLIAQEPAEVSGSPLALLRRGIARARLLHFEAARIDLEGARRRAQEDDGAHELQQRIATERVNLELVCKDAAAAWSAALAALPEGEGAPDVAPELALAVGHAALALGDPAALERADSIVGQARTRPGAPPGLLQPVHVQLALRRGEVDLAAKRLPPAGEPQSIDLVLARGAVLMAQGDRAGARACFAEVRGAWRQQNLSGDVAWFNGQGFARMLKGDVANAVLADDAAAALAPWHPAPSFYAGKLALAGWADGQVALPWLREALRRDPWNPGALDLLWSILTTLGDEPSLDEAARVLDARCALDPELAEADSVDVRLLRAALLVRRGEWSRAWSALDEVERVDPRRGPGRTPLLRAAVLRMARGEQAASLQRLAGGRSAAELERDYRAAAFDELPDRLEVARLDLAAGDATRALAGLDRALRLDLRPATLVDRQRASALVLHARASAALGRTDGVAATLEAVIAWNPPAPIPPEAALASIAHAPELSRLEGDPVFARVLAELQRRASRGW